MDHIRKRWILPRLRSALRVMPVVVLTGARQTGKSTLAGQCGAGRHAYTFDDLGVLDTARRHPGELLSGLPVTLDEIQRAPEMLLAVKRAVDARRRAGDYLLTGSANLLLMDKVADTLAGRALYLELPPFCPCEWLGRAGGLEPLDRLFAADFDLREWPVVRGDWTTWLLRGGYPSALGIADHADRTLWHSAYVQTYLERDLRQLSAISNLPDFQRVMALAAHRTGRLLNQAELARDAGLSHPTTHRHLNLLETGCLLHRIRPYATNPSVALVKSPKLLWADSGLAAVLAGLRDPKDLAGRPDAGFWLEQTIYQTLRVWVSLDPLHRRIHYWRDRSGREVDFILEQDGRCVALEIKLASRVTAGDTTGLRAFREAAGKKSGLVRSLVLHAGDACPLDRDTAALPWGWMVPAD
ncbi:MAG: ATP-binding protein [Kiritimatiellia bacterium]